MCKNKHDSKNTTHNKKTLNPVHLIFTMKVANSPFKHKIVFYYSLKPSYDSRKPSYALYHAFTLLPFGS